MSESLREPEGSARRAGEVHEGWELVDFTAEGPFSEVWRATRGDEAAALKFARGEVGERMLAEEARVLDKLASKDRAAKLLSASPNLSYPRVAAGALHYAPPRGSQPGILATLWIPDGSLRRRLKGVAGADERARLLGVFCDLANAVSVLHSLQVVHGDLKPENVLLCEHTTQDLPYLVDFGLGRHLRTARLEQSLKASLQSEDALTGGTLAYMAPEILKGGEPSEQGDVYALGVMLHEVLVGRRPSKVSTPAELKRSVPEALIPILLKALAYEPSERYWCARAFADDLADQREALSATGVFRLGRTLGRFVLGGVAAFFVALRYLSVATLLLGYLTLVVGIVVTCLNKGSEGLLALLIFFPIALLHGVVRWEGPETAEEAGSRTAGHVISRREAYAAEQRRRSLEAGGGRR